MSDQEKTKLVKVKLDNGITIWVEARDLDTPKRVSKDSGSPEESKDSDKQKK